MFKYVYFYLIEKRLIFLEIKGFDLWVGFFCFVKCYLRR